MSNWFQTIADVEASPEEAEALATAILAWLADTGIVVAEATDCAGPTLGHAPGPAYATAVTEPDPHLLTLNTNGVAFDTDRAVHFSMGADQITCPYCKHAIALTDEQGDPNQAWQDLSETIGIWYDGGSGDRPCPNCGRAVDLNDWTWSPPWGFGYLGITFWNWPTLNPQFLTAIAARLGHRTVYTSGKV
jgi:hypothetical protein